MVLIRLAQRLLGLQPGLTRSLAEADFVRTLNQLKYSRGCYPKLSGPWLLPLRDFSQKKEVKPLDRDRANRDLGCSRRFLNLG